MPSPHELSVRSFDELGEVGRRLRALAEEMDREGERIASAMEAIEAGVPEGHGWYGDAFRRFYQQPVGGEPREKVLKRYLRDGLAVALYGDGVCQSAETYAASERDGRRLVDDDVSRHGGG